MLRGATNTGARVKAYSPCRKGRPNASSSPFQKRSGGSRLLHPRESRQALVTFRIESYGPRALLVRFLNPTEGSTFDRIQAALRHFETHPQAGLIEVTPGFATLLFEFQNTMLPEPASWALGLERLFSGEAVSTSPRRTVDIPVIYDGPDLERVATLRNLHPDEVIRRHTAPVYRVQILGFSPGFPYLAGLDPQLHVPRLSTPRVQVPAGSVAIGGEHTGIYPVSTAGGWNLIGRTTAQLVDSAWANRGQPEAFLLHPGDAVRFVDATTTSTRAPRRVPAEARSS